MTDLAAALRDIRSLVEMGEPLDTAALGEVLAEVPKQAVSLSDDELLAIKVEVDELFLLAKEQRDDLAMRLEEIHLRRSAAQGYNHLRTLHKAQRLSKRA